MIDSLLRMSSLVLLINQPTLLAACAQYMCVDRFHVTYPESSIWKVILWHTKIFSIFPGSTEQSSYLKILSANCIWETLSYFPKISLSLNKLLATLVNRNNKICINLDCRFINQYGPGRFRWANLLFQH